MVVVLSQLNTSAALTRSSSEGPEVMTDEFFNKWTRDAGDEHGGTIFDSPANIIISRLHTLDGRKWSLKGRIYWVNMEGELRRFRPVPDSGGWRNDVYLVWESNDGELTQAWPSRRRLPPAAAAAAGQLIPATGIDHNATQTKFDSFFHIWTREAFGHARNAIAAGRVVERVAERRWGGGRRERR